MRNANPEDQEINEVILALEIGDDIDDEDLPDGDDEDTDLEPEYNDFIPTLDLDTNSLETGQQQVSYTDRGPNDAVLSGPVVGGWGPGRFHRSRRAAYAFLVEKYGESRIRITPQSTGRWSFLIKNLKVQG